VSRTKAVAALVSGLDAECERRLRRKGLLGFDDVKVLMGQWVRSEEARLRREAVDFRLDARYDHWLLDEFQDTSRAEWTGIVPLLDEAATSEDGSVFVVGDRKQAIYGWRGGDVTLFDEVSNRYNRDGSLGVRTMPDSWRSCPAVLDLVNVVCGDRATVSELFGDAMAARWQWEDHVSAKPTLTGESRVEVVSKDERSDRLVELLREIGVGERALTCGVLVRTNTQVREIASLLREEGFDVIEEGRRRPLEDNAVGVALFHLIKWLADPADAFARELIAMSPLSGIIELRFGEAWQKAWEGLLEDAQARGFATMAESAIEPLWEGLSEFSRRRAGDVLAALAQFDAGGESSAREAARWLAGLEIAQSPGTAAVQVMTVHKSKGLGFDVVILPEIEDTQVPDRGDFTIAKGVSSGRKWLLEPPPSWVRKLVPALAEAEAQWADDQRYEAMCVLYVALTRAKRGLYVLLPEPPKSRKSAEAWSSPASWITRSAASLDGPTIFQSGDPGWFQSVEARESRLQPEMPELGGAVPRRERSTPSDAKKSTGVMIARSASGMKFGSEVHEAFEQVGWVDEQEARLPETDAGRLVRELIGSRSLRSMFERRGRLIDLHREQPFDVVVKGVWMSGIIDRLHVHRESSGRVTLVEVIDFKTDAVEQAEDLVERYAGQLQMYRKALAVLHPDVRICCLLVSTRLGMVVECL
ncbi:MAG: 3'-5' exonuclease, partial [Verrucomicrobiales bacterium]